MLICKDMKYLDIPVSITPEQEQAFNFELVENEESDQFCKIWSEGKELYVDENLAYIKGDMPLEWREPAIAKLVLILGANRHLDGQLTV